MANEVKGHELLELADIITKREYNWGLVRTRQFTEELVRRLCEEGGIAYTTMADSIEALYQGGFIDEASRVNLHGVRVLGNKAVHEGDNDEGDAKNAYYMYREELQKAGGKQHKVSYERTPVQYTRPAREDDDDGQPRQRKGFSREEDIDIHMAGRQRKPVQKKKKQQSGGLYGVLKWVIPALVGILLIILIISLVRSASNKPAEAEPETTTIEIETTEEETTEEETTPAPTEPPTTEAPVSYKIKGEGVRIRYANDTNREHEKFENGTVIGPVEDFGQLEISGRSYDFVKFRYDGSDLIVCKDYIEKVE